MTTSGIGSQRYEFIMRSMMLVGVMLFLAFVWVLSDILLLLFGALLVAIILHAIADLIARFSHFSHTIALAVGVVLISFAVLTAVLLPGPAVVDQVRLLLDRLPNALSELTTRLQLGSFNEIVEGAGSASSLGKLAVQLFTWGSAVASVLASIAIVLVGGIYLAAQPDVYRNGLLDLMPKSFRPKIRSTLDACGQSLRRWLTGQLVAMVLVGTLTGVGLWVAGVPSAMALGLITGIAEFVPLFGPFFALIPIFVMASSQGTETVAWAVGLFILVQQVESNLIAPLVAEHTVAVAPALGLFAVLAMGVLFGPLGLLLAYPLVVVGAVLIRQLYIDEFLDEPNDRLGEMSDD